jgi:cytidylate kinase
MMPHPPLLITIDGPAGAGKTTVSQMLAQRLSYRYLDTGALYRGVAYEAQAAGVAADDDRGLERVCRRLRFDIQAGRLISGGVDIGDRIRSPQITMLASAVSARPVVRQALLEIQRRLGRDKGLVAEGRDMGTVVFPDADLKFYLDAGARQRAVRRFEQYGGEGGQTLDQIERDIRLRDANDSSRETAPLKPADDAVIIDSTALDARQVVERMVAYIK